jgi:hypothetical protein
MPTFLWFLRLLSFSFLVEKTYTQQGCAHIRRLHPDWAARPALMSRAAHFFFLWWRKLIHSKGARTAATSTPIGPRARL